MTAATSPAKSSVSTVACTSSVLSLAGRKAPTRFVGSNRSNRRDCRKKHRHGRSRASNRGEPRRPLVCRVRCGWIAVPRRKCQELAPAHSRPKHHGRLYDGSQRRTNRWARGRSNRQSCAAHRRKKVCTHTSECSILFDAARWLLTRPRRPLTGLAWLAPSVVRISTRDLLIGPVKDARAGRQGTRASDRIGSTASSGGRGRRHPVRRTYSDGLRTRFRLLGSRLSKEALMRSDVCENGERVPASLGVQPQSNEGWVRRTVRARYW